MFYGDLVESWALLYFLGGGCLMPHLNSFIKRIPARHKGQHENAKTNRENTRLGNWVSLTNKMFLKVSFLFLLRGE